MSNMNITWHFIYGSSRYPFKSRRIFIKGKNQELVCIYDTFVRGVMICFIQDAEHTRLRRTVKWFKKLIYLIVCTAFHILCDELIRIHHRHQNLVWKKQTILCWTETLPLSGNSALVSRSEKLFASEHLVQYNLNQLSAGRRIRFYRF